MEAPPPFDDLISQCEHSAVHLEMRDAYTPDDPAFLAWKSGQLAEPLDANRPWFELVRTHVARGVEFRRARVISEPVTDYIRFEHEVTEAVNVAAGEQVRWLPRRLASDLRLPGNDFWLFDDRLVLFNHFAGDGSSLGPQGKELREEPYVIELCRATFKAAWARAIDHKTYQPV